MSKVHTLEKNGKVKNNPNKDAHQQNSTNDQRDTSQQNFTVSAINGRDDLNDYREDFLFSIGEVKANCWNLDSAATRHVCNDRAFFNSLDESLKGRVKMPNGEYIDVMGIGTVKLSFLDGNDNINKAKMEEVVYAPSAVGNFLSVSRLTKLNYRVEFSRSRGEIKYRNIVVGIANVTENGMFSLRQPCKESVF